VSYSRFDHLGKKNDCSQNLATDTWTHAHWHTDARRWDSCVVEIPFRNQEMMGCQKREVRVHTGLVNHWVICTRVTYSGLHQYFKCLHSLLKNFHIRIPDRHTDHFSSASKLLAILLELRSRKLAPHWLIPQWSNKKWHCPRTSNHCSLDYRLQLTAPHDGCSTYHNRTDTAIRS
jgi:hypothetical protein